MLKILRDNKEEEDEEGCSRKRGAKVRGAHHDLSNKEKWKSLFGLLKTEEERKEYEEKVAI